MSRRERRRRQAGRGPSHPPIGSPAARGSGSPGRGVLPIPGWPIDLTKLLAAATLLLVVAFVFAALVPAGSALTPFMVGFFLGVATPFGVRYYG